MENFLIHDNLSVNDKGHLCLNGHDCVTLAQNFGTPLYLIDEDKVRQMCASYKNACDKYFDKANILYASKALSFKGIYKVIQEEGVFADAVSVGEIYTALCAGFDAKNLYFHGNAKTKSDIEFAIENGVGCIIADNFTELSNIDAFCASKDIKQDILLRITPGIDCHTHEKISTGKVDSKFGVSIETGQALEFVKEALSLKNINLLGIHCHVGSQAFEAQPFTDGADIMFAFMNEIKEKFGFECKILNLGGGFGVRYTNNQENLDIDKMMSIIGKNVRDNCEKYSLKMPELLFEPGRSLVAAAGVTLYSVVNVKTITGYKNYVAIDGGMADNPRYALYEAPYTCVVANKINEKPCFTADVVGRCCESGDAKQLGRTLRYVLPYKKVFMLVGVLMFVSSLVALIPSLILKRITDVVILNEDYAGLAYMVLSMALLAVVEISITFVHSRLMGKTGHSLIAQIRQDIFYKLQELPFEYFDNRPNGKIVVRVTEYVNGLANFFTNFVMMFVIYIIKILVVTVLMLVLSPKLTLIVFLTVIPMMAAVFALRYTIRKMFAVHRAKNSNRTAFLVETIMGEKIVKNYNRAELNLDIYNEVHDQCLKQWKRIFCRNELNTPIVEFFWNAGTLCLYAVALGMLLSGNSIINVGLMTTFTAYMSQFSGPLTQIAAMIQDLAQVSSNLEQVFDTIDYPVTIKDMDGSAELKNVEGNIDFNHITFAYEEGVNILEDFDLHVKKGETVALVGPTGAGKTTVINMLTRFYDVQQGSVTIDGKDVREVTLDSLRKEVGVLMQDPFIFKGTVMENIRYGRPDATDEECIAAAKAIYADRCIDKLKGGYEHVLDERGEGLSAGEKQLISFARIILKNPSVIILDEATSSIDTETENLIKQALDVIIKDKTAFIVAHRLSTIRNADRILYIANKGIAEQGNHEELMAKKGLYYALNI